ncbi:MAG: DUF3784 domain-containing protein [Clostridiales bacterium]|jgi:uncharacterized membrane protein|nr:DUF3784 domain-containing protein [Clostridiales bacterium]
MDIILGVTLACAGLFLRGGKLIFLIAGYNTLPKEEKERYDEKALSKFVGSLLIVIGVISLFFRLGVKLGRPAVSCAAIGLEFALVIAAAVYANTKNRFKKRS